MPPRAASRLTLNGWQRLWVVYSLILAAGFSLNTAANWPTTPPPRAEYQLTFEPQDHELTADRVSPGKGQPDTGMMDFWQILEAERHGVLPPDKVELLAEARRRGLVPPPGTPPSVNPFAQFVEPRRGLVPPVGSSASAAKSMPFDPDVYLASKRAEVAQIAARRLEALRDLRKQAVSSALAWWLGIVLGTYALGWSVGWVRQGFRTGRTQRSPPI
jgi:hypothetical protein